MLSNPKENWRGGRSLYSGTLEQQRWKERHSQRLWGSMERLLDEEGKGRDGDVAQRRVE